MVKVPRIARSMHAIHTVQFYPRSVHLPECNTFALTVPENYEGRPDTLIR